MKNINAFFKICQLKRGVTISKIASRLSLDPGYLSRTFNNKNHVRKERNLIKICGYFHLDMDFLLTDFPEFEKLCHSFKAAFYACEPVCHHLYQRICQVGRRFEWASPYYIDLLLVRLMYESEVMNQCPDFVKLLCKAYSSLEPDEQLILTSHVCLLEVTHPAHPFPEVTRHFWTMAHEAPPDSPAKGRLYYFGISFFHKRGNAKALYACYQQALSYYEKTNNAMMLDGLMMKYSFLLRMYGHLEKAIQSDLLIIEKFETQSEHTCDIAHLHHNIAWNYALLHDYQQAIIHYEHALKSIQNNEIYFYLAFCCYQVGNKEQAMDYIAQGLNSSNFAPYFILLLEWLEAMIQKRYSKKSYQLLLTVRRRYYQELDGITRDTVQMEIINYLYHTRQYALALQESRPLLNRRVQTVSQSIIDKQDQR